MTELKSVEYLLAEIVDAIHASGLDCMACTERYFLTEKDIKQGILHNGEEPVLPVINKAATFAPAWIAKDIGGAIAWSALALPTCRQHLKKEEETPLQRASKSGLAIPAPGSSGISHNN
jgi:hypothetical protein